MNFGKLLSFAVLFLALFVFGCGQNTSSERPPAATSYEASASQAVSSGTASESEPPSTQPAETTTTTQQPQTEEARYRIPPYFQDPAKAEPLAPILDPMTVLPEAQYAYRLAQQNPKLLTQLPCFCYCDRFGHKSLHDCFSSDHAQGCDVCMNEAIEASQMAAKGMSPKDIRDAIIAKHHPRANEGE